MAEDMGRKHGRGQTGAGRKVASMSQEKGWVRCNDIPEAAWKLAMQRTRGLARERLGWDPNLEHLLANAYLQGVTDVGANLELVKRIVDDAQPRPDPADYYAGA
jgi:hypothetical protein